MINNQCLLMYFEKTYITTTQTIQISAIISLKLPYLQKSTTHPLSPK